MARYLALIIAISLAAAACTPATGDSATSDRVLPTTTAAPTTTTQAPEPTVSTVRIGVDSPVLTVNPLSDQLNGANRLVGRAVWATVYDIDPVTWERIPDVVSSLPSQTPGAIEVASDGSMTVRYEVARGATWSDGTPISGADIAFTADAMASIAGGETRSVMGTVIATDAVDRLAWITFSEASLAFEDALWVILPAHVLSEVVDLTFGNAMGWPSGGPFMVSAEQTSGDLVLERNPYYWKVDDQGKDLPYLDTLTIVSVDEPDQQMDLFAAGSVDVIVPSPVQVTVDRLAAFASDGAELQVVAAPIVEHLTFQFADSRDAVNPASWNSALDYRTAVALSIDRQSILEGAGVAWLVDAPGMLKPLGMSAWSEFSYDPATAADLVDGLAGGGAFAIPPHAILSSTANGDARMVIGDALVSSFGEIGVNLDTSYLDSLIFFGETIGTGEFDIGMWAWISDGGFANQLSLLGLFDPASEAAAANYGNWGSGDSFGVATETFSDLVAEARTTTDAQRFSEIVDSAETILAENLPLIPLFLRSSTAAIWPDSVSGVVHNRSLSEITWNVETWRTPNG